MKHLILLIGFLFATSVFAGKNVSNCVSENYNSAMNAECFIKFDMESTKAGFITTGFTGVVKKFSAEFNWNGSEFANTLIKINPRDIDTDNGSRNDKMYEQSFGVDKFAQLVVQIGGPLKAGNHNNVPALLTVRGKIKEITLNMEITVSKENEFVIKGTSQMSIKELEIPDPSIFIAKVRDSVDLSFQLKGTLSE